MDDLVRAPEPGGEAAQDVRAAEIGGDEGEQSWHGDDEEGGGEEEEVVGEEPGEAEATPRAARPPRTPLVFPTLPSDSRVTVTISAIEQDIANRSGIDTYVTSWNAYGQWHGQSYGQPPPLLPVTNVKSNVARSIWYTDLQTATDFVIWMGSPQGGKAAPAVLSSPITPSSLIHAHLLKQHPSHTTILHDSPFPTRGTRAAQVRGARTALNFLLNAAFQLLRSGGHTHVSQTCAAKISVKDPVCFLPPRLISMVSLDIVARYC